MEQCAIEEQVGDKLTACSTSINLFEAQKLIHEGGQVDSLMSGYLNLYDLEQGAKFSKATS